MGVVPPKKEFLKFLREITEKHGSLLIFDEVITGFRLSLGGAQKLYGVKPDLTTLGKIVGGGMPLAVYGGRKEIMECVAPLGSVYQAGTLSGKNAVIIEPTRFTLSPAFFIAFSIFADTKRYAEYYNHLLENGIYAAPSQFEAMFVSFAHTDYDIEKTCQVIESFK